MNKDIEQRGGMLGVETRADNDKRTLVGYAAVFNSDTDIGGWWIERISPGAFSTTINDDVRALVDHNAGRVIGRTRSNTLRLAEDSKGLRVEIDIPNTTDGNDLWELVERGDISGMSFGFRVTKQEWDETVDPPIRTINEVELFEVSAVAFPAYDDTSIGKRSLDEWRSANHTEEETDADTPEENPDNVPENRAVPNLKARLSMDLDLRLRTHR